MRKILIIEDDLALRTQVKEVLEGYDYEVVVAVDFHRIESW